ncbi:MAG: phage minor head protein [Candidatus Thorarchaeota archaeon]
MMITQQLHNVYVTYANVDPTRTTSLRNAFARDMKRRFKELTKAIRIGVVDEDAFGLGLAGAPYRVMVQQVNTPGEGAFAFPRSVDKISSFMRWLETQVENGILTTGEFDQVGVGIEGAWTNRYILDSYKRGMLRARQEMKKQGANIPAIDPSTQFIAGFGMPLHIDRLGVLYTRVFSELKGITATMDQIISRILTQGIADGDNPRLLARKLVAAIDGTGAGELGLDISYIHPRTGQEVNYFIPARRRAEIMARTEIIRAHHQAMIQEYMNWGVEGVTILAEWKTAGDHRVCERCEAHEGETFTLEVAMNMIPLHPQCRCLALPYRREWETIREVIPENIF